MTKSAIFAAICVTVCAIGQEKPTAGKDGWVSMFDGKTLDGWKDRKEVSGEAGGGRGAEGGVSGQGAGGRRTALRVWTETAGRPGRVRRRFG